MSGFQSLNWALISTELLKPDPCEQYRLMLIAGRVKWDGFQIAVRNLYKKGTGTKEKQSHLTSCKEKYWCFRLIRALVLLFLFPSILCSTDFDYNNLHVCLSPCYLLKLLVGWGDLSYLYVPENYENDSYFDLSFLLPEGRFGGQSLGDINSLTSSCMKKV